MNRKNLVLTMAVLLSAVFVIATCLSALAESPKFYVRLINPSNQTLEYQVEWCTRAGNNHSGFKSFTIKHSQTLVHSGPNGCGRMNVRIETKGRGWQNYSYDAVADKSGEGATHEFYSNQGWRLR